MNKPQLLAELLEGKHTFDHDTFSIVSAIWHLEDYSGITPEVHELLTQALTLMVESAKDENIEAFLIDYDIE